MKFLRFILAFMFMAVLVLPFTVYGQGSGDSKKGGRRQEESRDSLVRLVSADSLMLFEENHQTFRKTVGKPVRFLHNNTYLLCDTAIWNVDDQIINAYGRVKIIQDQTTLSSDRLIYYVERDLAEFRGSVVKLEDKDGNTLKTMFLDYNTKDSVAVFRNGASMRDKDGQIIESLSGSYDARSKVFDFSDNVNMYTDSVFVKTTHLTYESERSLATFGYNTNAWKDESMLSANAGNYNRAEELFFFNRDVHVMNENQEAWSDSLYFNRATMDITMLGHTQLTDTTRNVYSVAGSLVYIDSLSRVTLTRLPAVVAEVDDEENGRDSVWFGADTIVYWSVKRCLLDSLEVVDAQTRLKSIDTDPVTQLRKTAAEAAAKAAAEAAENDPNNADAAARRKADYEKQHQKSASSGKKKAGPQKPERIKFTKPQPVADPPAETDTTEPAALPPAESDPVPPASLPPASELPASNDSTEVSPPAEPAPLPPAESAPVPPASLPPASELPAVSDTTGVVPSDASDSTEVALPAEPLDTTKIGFLSAMGKVRVFKKTMQVRCDSLRYCDLDSLARLYVEPKIWNEGNHQYIADSIYVVIRDSRMEKANLMSEAFIHIQEDSTHFDQIRGAEMVAYFNEDNKLDRFDALGGASALFYIEENDVLATVNKKDAKMLSAGFKDGSIQRIHYFQEAKSDAYPVVQMSDEDRKLKGFSWTPDERPKDRFDITDLSLRKSQRSRYARVPQASFPQTEIYFPGYIDEVHRQIAYRDSMKVVRERERELARAMAAAADSTALSPADSLSAAVDSLGFQLDSLSGQLDSLVNHSDSLGLSAPSETVEPSDTVSMADLTPEEAIRLQKEAEKKAKAAAKAEKKAQREAAKAEKLAALEAKWAEKDRLDSLKQQERAAKKQARLRKKKEKALNAQLRQEAKDKAALERYIYLYERRKAKEDARKAK